MARTAASVTPPSVPPRARWPRSDAKPTFRRGPQPFGRQICQPPPRIGSASETRQAADRAGSGTEAVTASATTVSASGAERTSDRLGRGRTRRLSRSPLVRSCQTSATTAVRKEIRPAPQMLDGTPNRSAHQPATDAPTGVLPRKTSTYSAMTRPRYRPCTPIWTRWFADCARYTEKNPVGTSRIIATMNDGAKPTTNSSNPNAAAAPIIMYAPGRLRRPLPARAPPNAPTASDVVSRPNDDGPA